MKFQLSELLPKILPADLDEWRLKTYEVVDPLPTWHWKRGVPVCVECPSDHPRRFGRITVVHTLRADRETCFCNCGKRSMKELDQE